MKGWFGKLECEELAIIEEQALANAASVGTFLLGHDRKSSNGSQFQKTPPNTKKYNIVRHILCQHTVLRQKFHLLSPETLSQGRTKID